MQKHHHHALPAALFVRGGSCATPCGGTSAYSSRFTSVVRRLPGNGAKGIGETESHGSRARSQHLTTIRLTTVHHAVSRPSNRPRIGSGCSAYMTLDSTYLRCPPVSCNFRAPSATELAIYHRGLDQLIIALHCTSSLGRICQDGGSQCLLATRPRLAHAKVDQVIEQSGTWKRPRVRMHIPLTIGTIAFDTIKVGSSLRGMDSLPCLLLPTSVVPLSCCTHAIECTNAPPRRDLTM